MPGRRLRPALPTPPSGSTAAAGSGRRQVHLEPLRELAQAGVEAGVVTDEDLAVPADDVARRLLLRGPSGGDLGQVALAGREHPGAVLLGAIPMYRARSFPAAGRSSPTPARLGEVVRDLLAGFPGERVQVGPLGAGHRLVAGGPVRRVLLRIRGQVAGVAHAGTGTPGAV